MSKQERETSTFAPYLRNQKDLAAARERVSSLETKIAETTEAERRATAGIPSKDDLTRQREDIEAAVALGHVTPAEAKKRRDEIEKLGNSYSTRLDNADSARQARAGLHRLLATARSEAESLEAPREMLLVQALREQAEGIAAEYVSHAKPTRDAFVRLLAIDSLLGARAGPSARFAPPNAQAAFHLPGSHQLHAFDGLYDVRNNYGLFNKSIHEDVREAVDALRESLSAIGVER